MQTLWKDLRYGARMLFKHRGFTAVALVSLALGIGLNTAIFSLVNAVLFRPLPGIEAPAQLVWFRAPLSYPDFEEFRDQSDVFAGITASGGTTSFGLGGGDRPELISGEFVTASYFDVLGVRAATGRTFLPAEDHEPGAHTVAVISHGLWQRRFNSDSDIIGRTMPLNGLTFTIVGVTPPGFAGKELGKPVEVWVPISMHPTLNPALDGEETRRADSLTSRGFHWLQVVARLREGVSREQAEAELRTIAARQSEGFDAGRRAEHLRSVELVAVSGGLDPRDRLEALPLAGALMGLVALVLGVACANVAGLLLARAALRQKEVAVRQALGASRRRLVRQLLTESVLLSLVGGAAGLLLAVWVVELLARLTSATPLGQVDLNPDARVLAFTFVVSVLTGVLFGLAPALQSSRPDLVLALKGEGVIGGRGYRRSRLRDAFVVAQVTLCVVLLVGAGLCARSLRNAQHVDPGFEARNGLTLPVDLGLLRYEKERGQEFYRELVARVEALPGVERASLMRFVPLGLSFAQREVYTQGAPAEGGAVRVGFNVVGAGYFQTMGIPILRGREFGPDERENAPRAVIINETLARKLWPDAEPIGQRLSLEGARGPFVEVVGVARDTKYATLGERARPFVYEPLGESYQPQMTLVVRTAGEPGRLVEPVREAARALDPNLPVADIKTLDEQVSLSLFPARFAAALLGSFGLLALVLAAVGVYGIVSYAVSTRTHEIGVRLALGARRADVLRVVVGEGMTVVSVGLLFGLAVSLAAARLAGGLLYGVSPTDPATFAGITLLLAAVGLLASLLPARRAMRVEPMEALRYE